MATILIADKRQAFLSDMQTRLVLEDAEFECAGFLTSVESLEGLLEKDDNIDFVAIAANLLPDADLSFSDSVKTIVYGTSDNDRKTARAVGLTYIGTYKNTGSLLGKLNEIDVERLRYRSNGNGGQEKTAEPVPADARRGGVREGSRNVPKRVPEKRFDPADEETEEIREDLKRRDVRHKDTPDYDDGVILEDDLRSSRNAEKRLSRRELEPPRRHRREEYDDYDDLDGYEDYGDHDNGESGDKYDDVRADNRRERTARSKNREESETPRRTSIRREDDSVEQDTSSISEYLDEREQKGRHSVEEAIERDLHPDKDSSTKTVVVYSAKGGVGKTTIAAEIATYLAQLPHGRGTYRVCVVDYNIDFGNVRTTLGLSVKSTNMTFWAADIRARINEAQKNNETPPLNYNKDEIEGFLTKVTKDNIGKNLELYTLIAPIAHEDSMDIGQVELTTMLKNIVKNGDFDFVVCDTGNNTRDSSIIALEVAQYVLLVATQDITTTDCIDSFLRTMRKMKFDMRKVKLIVNMLSNGTGISCAEIEDYMKDIFNKHFDAKCDCIARILYDNEVRLANNKGIPLTVSSPRSKFTKELAPVVDFLTDGEKIETKKKGRGLFGKKKGR